MIKVVWDLYIRLRFKLVGFFRGIDLEVVEVGLAKVFFCE